MKNVLYPFSDLKALFLTLLKNLKPSDWQKSTELDNHKVNDLVTELLSFYNIKSETFNNENLNRNIVKQKNNYLPLDVIHQFKSKLCAPQIIDESQANTADHYAKCWLLQQYIRQAINNQLLLAQKFYAPFLHYTMAFVPIHYLNAVARTGDKIKVEIVGDAGGVWIIEKTPVDWEFVITQEQTFVTTVYLDQQIAWLLFSNALHVSEIGQYYQILGDKILGNHLMSLRVSLNFF